MKYTLPEKFHERVLKLEILIEQQKETISHDHLKQLTELYSVSVPFPFITSLNLHFVCEASDRVLWVHGSGRNVHGLEPQDAVHSRQAASTRGT